MSSSTLAETDTLGKEPLSSPWAALLDYQEQVANFWRASLSGWPLFPHASAGDEEIRSVSSPSRTLVDVPQDSGLSKAASQRPEDAVNQTQSSGEANRTGFASPPERHPPTSKERREGQSHPGKPAAKRAQREHPKDKKGPERTGRAAPAVLAGLRHRSYSVKLAAVSAMSTNKKLRTQEAVPLLKRIVDNQTIRRRDPELRTAAKTVLQKSRQETAKRSPQAAQQRSPATSKSHRRGARA